jgi:hypothetical protein
MAQVKAQIGEDTALDRLAEAREDHDPQNVLLSIDPGEVHCGVALFVGESCVDCWEMAPHALFRFLETALRCKWLGTLVVEQFRLYPWMAEQQAFSELLTVQYIGVIKWLWALFGALGDSEDLVKDGKRVAQALEWCTYVENPATIKNPTRSILKARKIPQVSRRLKAGGHAADAELHGHYYLMYQRGQVPTFARGRGGFPAETVVVEAPGLEPKKQAKPRDVKKTGQAKAQAGGGELAKVARKRTQGRRIEKMGARTAADILRGRP